MKPLYRFLTTGVAKVKSPTGDFSRACDAVEIYGCVGGYTLKMYRLYQPGATAPAPSLMLEHRIAGSSLIVDDECISVSMAFSSGCSAPSTFVTLEAHPGEFVRPDPYFGKDMGAAQDELIRTMRDAQHQLTLIERLADPNPEEHPHLVETKRALINIMAGTVTRCEKRLATIRASKRGA